MSGVLVLKQGWSPAQQMCFSLTTAAILMMWLLTAALVITVTVLYYLLARWFIIRGWARAACIAELMFCHGTQSMGFVTVTVCCSVSMVSKTLCSHFSGQRSTMATHTLGLNFTMKSWAESLALMSVIMNGHYLKWTQLLCMIWRYRLWAACPCLSWSAVAFSRPIIVELDSEDF